MGSEEIYNFRKVNAQISTGGQPTEDQLRSAAAEGFEVVINLSIHDPQYELPDEAGLVKSLGMTYYHIPVVWDEPKERDFEAFEAIVSGLGDAKTLIHCAANFRVTAFFSLYAMKNLGWSQDQAAEFRRSVWQGSEYPVWEAFIREMEG